MAAGDTIEVSQALALSVTTFLAGGAGVGASYFSGAYIG
jgi:hypothetical protein